MTASDGGPLAGYSVNCSTLFTEYPLLERPAAARAAGFGTVEFWWPFEEPVPADAQIREFEAAVRDAGVQLGALNFYGGDMPAGERGVLSLPDRGDQFRANTAVVAGIGERLGCRLFNALYGNRSTGCTPEEQDAEALRNLRAAARAVAPFGGTVLLEPLSGAPDYPLHTAADAAAVLQQAHDAGAENVALLADFYHLAVNGEDVAALIADDAARFGHVQIADAPGRGAPGTGSLPLARWVRELRAGGYAGDVSLEYFAPADGMTLPDGTSLQDFLVAGDTSPDGVSSTEV